MKGLTKRISVGVMAVSLVMSSSLLAFAEDQKTGTSGGTGVIEGIVETKVFKVALPTEATGAYNYFADPQGLIRKTNAAKYIGATFGEGNVFFKNSDTSYSNVSNVATIVNKSSAPLSVTVKAKATVGSSTGAANLATSKTFDDSDTSLAIYLGLIDSSETPVEKAITATDTTDASDAILKAVLGAAPEDAYEYSYKDNAYQYAIKDDVSAFKFAEYSFKITGVANEKAAWKADTVLPTVSVTWDVDLAAAGDTVTVATPAQIAAPSIATTTYAMVANTAIDIPVNLGSGDLAATTVSKVMDPTGAWDYLSGPNQASFDATNKKITLSAGMVDACISANVGSIKVIFDDAAGTAIDVTLTK